MLTLLVRAGTVLIVVVTFVLNCNRAYAQVAPTSTATISGSVNDTLGKPVSDAKVSLAGPRNATTTTDSHGLFVFVGMPLGTYQLSASITSLGGVTRSLSVEGDTNVAIQYEPALANGLKTIARVSSTANATFNVTSASITQVSPIQNAFNGKTSWRTILEQIPGVSQAGLGVGNFAYAAVADSPFVPVQVSINGALPYETATLLDDMPLIGNGSLCSVGGAGTNLGLYPLNGFGAADVIRGPGASAPSIVDSIGGSLLLTAPRPVSENHYELSLSSDPYGGIVANGLAAIHVGKLSLTATYGVNNSPGPTHDETTFPLFVATPIIDGKEFIPYSAPCSPPSCQYGSYLYNPNFGNGGGFYGYQGGLVACCFSESSAWRQHSGSLALNYVFSPALNVEVFYAGQISQMPHIGQGYYVNFLPPPGYAGDFPAGAYSLGLDGLYSGDAWSQVSSLLEERVNLKIGEGSLRLEALQNRTFSNQLTTYVSPTSLQLFGGGSYCNNPSCTSTTPAVFNGETHSVLFPNLLFTSLLRTNNRDLLANYTTPIGNTFHVGASFVRSYYDTPTLNSFECDGVLYYKDITPDAISQTTNESRLYIGGNLSQKTSLDLSFYFANVDYHVPNPDNTQSYQTPGADIAYTDTSYSYAAPRLGFVWRPVANLAVRAAAGGGFAEAPLSNLIGNNESCAPASATCEVTLENLGLQPEKSFAFDVGGDLRLRQNTVISLDMYRATLFGQFYNSTTFSGIGTCPGNTTAPCYVAQFGNLGVSRMEGILLDMHRDVPHGIYWALSGGLTRGYVISVPAGFYNTATCTNCTNLNVVPGINFNGTYTNGVASGAPTGGVSVPYSQALGSLGYRWNADKYIDVVGTYYGNNNSYFRPAFVELDGHVEYPLSQELSLLVTFRNITGIYDDATQISTPTGFSGAPTISGLPYPLYQEEYGPRTVLFTVRLSL